MKTLISGLPLSVPTGGIVEPLDLDLATQQKLLKWLSFWQVLQLRRCAERARDLVKHARDEPALSAQKKVLKKAMELASALAQILEQSPMTADAELLRVFYKKLGGVNEQQIMAFKLKTLAIGIDESLSMLPIQDHKRSHTNFVSMIAEVLNPAGVKTSFSENTRFFKISKTMFEAAGIYQSPAAAIKVFIGK